MTLQEQIMGQMKMAMKNKDKISLEALRAIKAAISLAKTASGRKDELQAEEETRLLQKLAKQRRESIEIFSRENRPELASKEMAQLSVIEKFLPKQLSQNALEKIIEEVLQETNAKTMSDMGKVMPKIMAKTAGAADGKTISSILKAKLTA